MKKLVARWELPVIRVASYLFVVGGFFQGKTEAVEKESGLSFDLSSVCKLV